MILRSGKGSQILVDGKDIAPVVTRIEVEQAGKTAPILRLTLDPVMVTTFSQDAQIRIDGLDDCPEQMAREAYRLLRERFEPEAAERVGP